MGVSPLHDSTVGLIRNLNTNHMSPQFFVTYDNLFQTVHSAEGKPPVEWPDIIACNRFRSDFDDSYFVPELAGECLTPVDLAWCQEVELDHLNQEAYHDGDNPQKAPDDAPAQRAPPQDDTALQRAPHDSPARDGTTPPHRAPPHIEDLPCVYTLQD